MNELKKSDIILIIVLLAFSTIVGSSILIKRNLVFNENEDIIKPEIVYDTFETCETMMNNLKTGKTTYDLICPSEYTIQKMIRLDMLDTYDYNLKDKNGNTHAIINIPCFDNRNASLSSVSNFIITYINIILVTIFKFFI